MIEMLENIQCFRCLQKGRPASHFTRTIINNISDEQIDDKKYKLNKSGKSTKTIKSESITKLHNYQIKMKKGIYYIEYQN